MINLEIKILRFLNDPILNKYRKNLFLLSKGSIHTPGKESPKVNPQFKDYLHHYLRKWKILYTRIYSSHCDLYWYFVQDNRFITDRNVLSIGDILWATRSQLIEINFIRDICHFTRHFIRHSFHLQNIQLREEACIKQASILYNHEFEQDSGSPIHQSH